MNNHIRSYASGYRTTTYDILSFYMVQELRDNMDNLKKELPEILKELNIKANENVSPLTHLEEAVTNTLIERPIIPIKQHKPTISNRLSSGISNIARTPSRVANYVGRKVGNAIKYTIPVTHVSVRGGKYSNKKYKSKRKTKRKY